MKHYTLKKPNRLGTPLYMAPQLLTTCQYTNKCDIWSLGNLHYQLLFGHTPWPEINSVEHLIQQIYTIPI